MGFPLSSFQQLSRLCERDELVLRHFARFKLVAIIIHGNDKPLIRRVKYSFSRLHISTGNSFAFITFINPPESWKRTHNDWMREKDRLAVGDGCEDESFMFSIQDRLGLPLDSACLLLTNNLLSDRYIILPTSEPEIIDQLEGIGRFASEHEERFEVAGGEFLDYLEGIGAPYSEQTPDGKSLARNIADLLAVRALDGSGTARDEDAQYKQRNEARKWLDDTLRAFREELKKLRSDQSEDGAERAEDVLQRYSSLLALIAEKDGQDSLLQCRNEENYIIESQTHIFSSSENNLFSSPLHPFIPDRDPGLESASRNYLHNYNWLVYCYMDRFNTESHSNGHFASLLSSDEFALDFSPFGNFLGKVIEEETNASVIQLIRKLLGISMPKYYRLWEEDLWHLPPVCTGNKRILLNRKGARRGDAQYADGCIPMGEAACVLRELVNDTERCTGLGRYGEEGFIQDLDAFARQRNMATHTGVFQEDGFRELFKQFCQMFEWHIPEMCQLKKTLKGE